MKSLSIPCATWLRTNLKCRGRQIALDIAKGLIYLHSKQIAHLDLKSPNVMLAADGKAKLGDVGLGKIVASARAIATESGQCQSQIKLYKQRLVLDHSLMQVIISVHGSPVLANAKSLSACIQKPQDF